MSGVRKRKRKENRKELIKKRREKKKETLDSLTKKMFALSLLSALNTTPRLYEFIEEENLGDYQIKLDEKSQNEK